MMRRFLIPLAVAACASGVALPRASADYFLGTAGVQADDGNSGVVAVVPGTAAITIQSNSGTSFTNSYVVNGGPGTVTDPSIPNIGGPDSQAFGVGLRLVAANNFQRYVGPGNGTLASNIQYLGGTGGSARDLVAVTVMSGFVESLDGAAATGHFTTGYLALYNPLSQDFEQDDPSTWGVFSSPTGPANTPVAVFRLGTPMDVYDTFTGNKLYDADLVNRSVANVVGVNNFGQFVFLQMSESEAIAAGFPGILADTEPGGAYVGPVTGYEDLPSGLFPQTRQTLNSSQTANDVVQADLDLLNRIAGLFGLSDLGGSLTGFATGLNSDADPDAGLLPFTTAYAPAANGLDPFGTQDISATFDTPTNATNSLDPGALGHIRVLAVPEPTSLVSCAVGAALMGLVAFRRRRASVAA